MIKIVIFYSWIYHQPAASADKRHVALIYELVNNVIAATDALPWP
jgi:hypothetical protein